MERGESSCSNSPGDDIWAKLVPVGSSYSDIELRSIEVAVCSEIKCSLSEKQEWCKITRKKDQSSALIQNRSADSILVDGTVVDKDDTTIIRCGSEIVLGPEADGYMRYMFKVMPTEETCKKQLKIILDPEHAKCSICLNVWHDVVTVAPCLHNFCNGCFSEWLKRCQEKRSSVLCPQCRAVVQFVGRNHFLHSIEENILQSDSSLRRSSEEISVLESYSSIKSPLVVCSGRKLRRKRARALPDEENDRDFPCPHCGTEYAGFQCNESTVHLQCQSCGGMMPSRSNVTVPQHCLGCDRAFCGAYWHAMGVTSFDAYPACNQDTLKPIADRTVTRIPFLAHEKNRHEQDITEKCIRQMGRSLQDVISEWIRKMSNREVDRTRLPLNHPDLITPQTHICRPEGTFFLGSVDASSQCHDAPMLANLLETKIDEIGRDKVVQIVTDNGANYKAAGKLLEQRISTLFWTPCAAHCLDLMLEDIGKLKDFKRSIESARRVTVFIYRHGRVLDTLREKTNGRDLVRPGATRFATAFLTLQSLYKHKDALRMLFVGEDWSRSKLTSTEAGKRVCDIVLSSRFWTAVENCIRASQPLLIVMRIVDADEIPAMPELSVAMDHAKNTIKESFANKSRVLKSVLDIIEARWADQMEVKLYGATLFLNPSKYFDLKQSDLTYAAKQRGMFNDVLEKMVTDEALQIKISNQVDDYEYMRGSFGKQLAIKQQKTKSPLDWWNAFGVHTIELQLLAKRIIGLCCSSSGCERNWSTFEFIHTKKRNRLEHQRLSDLVYIQYNRKIANRFQKRREEGTNFNPLIIEDFQWENEWVDNDVVHPGDNLLWSQVDEAIGASDNLQGRNLSRRAHVDEATGSRDGEILSYVRRRKSTSNVRLGLVDEEDEEDEPFPNDDEDVDDDYGQNDCYDKLVSFLLYWFRITLPKHFLPPEAVQRQDCWYGYECRTQHHNEEHARKRNHVCRPTRGTHTS